MGKILSLVNQKGGVAKTTTAINLAAGLALWGYRTLLVDLDPQGNASSGLGFFEIETETSIYNAFIGRAELSSLIVKTRTENLEMICSNGDLSGVEVELANDYERSVVLRRLLAPFIDTYDYILVDAPPSLGLLTINALTAATAVLVPLQAEYYAMEGLSKLLKTIELVRAGLHKKLAIEGIVVTMFDGRNNICRQVDQEIRDHFGPVVFETVIPRNVRLSEAPSHGSPIYDYDSSSTGAQAYLALTRELLWRSGIDAPALAIERRIDRSAS